MVWKGGKVEICYLPFTLLYFFILVSNLSMAGSSVVFYPSGELDWRINWVQNRFDYVQEPAFTDEFILQDVRLDPNYPRRFQEFSGDISGRFIEAIIIEPRSDRHKKWIRRLVGEVLKNQREDGRFGNPNLVFTKDQIDREHMALLWGNGRLLVGLATYYQSNPDPEVLTSAKRMADFFLRIFEECAQPDVIRRLENQGANGFICFTQWNEGLELLSRISGETKYREFAMKLEPLLPPPAPQHTHGYLTTLRGAMLIWESGKDSEILTRVEKRYEELQREGWFQLNGGVAEYFNKAYTRDEGCSEADLVRLCIQLWLATGKEIYLDHAEKCVFNSLFPSQFETGDFGHHTFDKRGYVQSPGQGRAWWCCSMHGLRALQEVKKIVIDSPRPRNIRVNLFLSGEFTSDDVDLIATRRSTSKGSFEYVMKFTKTTNAESAISIRHPSWAEKMDIFINGKSEFTSESKKGYVDITRVWVPGDEIKVVVSPEIKIVDSQGNLVNISELTQPKLVGIFVGPWLLGVNADTNPMFHGEPYLDNILLLPETSQMLKAFVEFGDERTNPLTSGPRLTLSYIHSGFPDPCIVKLTALSERSITPETTFTFLHLAKTNTQ
ncbi:MAG: glycoside hydrolase family 127 protein [Candidatus Hydrogenedentes bacterium]|nr:glycoside hydrolase family 127 protein [Candidatus Hydrogenedentota bacterium]